VLRVALRVAIIGEDPATTTIVWDGPHLDTPPEGTDSNDGVMLLGQGTSGVRIGRITFDGQNRANFGVRFRWGSYGTNEYFPTGNELHDLVIKNTETGIGAGWYAPGHPQDTAEYSRVIRTTIRGCTRAAIETLDWNSLLWSVWDSHFVGNAIGVSVPIGNVNVYDSIFEGSTDTDIRAGTIPFLAARGNYSTGSKQFFRIDGSIGEAALQNNVIVGAAGAPINVHDGNLTGLVFLMLAGNTVLSGSGPALSVSGAGVLSASNHWSSATWKDAGSGVVLRSLDDDTTATTAPPMPTLPKTPAWFEGPVVTATDFTAVAVQSAIDTAAAQANGGRAIAYVPLGLYYIDQTITFPPGVDVGLVSDAGGWARLVWSGGANGTLLKLNGPSRVFLQDLFTSGGYNGSSADNVLITNADQPGGSVELYGVGGGASDYGYSIEGIDQTFVELIAPHYMGGNKGAVNVTGSAGRDPLAVGPSNVRFIAGFPLTGSEDSAAAPVYSLTASSGAHVNLLDFWQEGTANHVVNLTDPASVTVANGSGGMGSLFENPSSFQASGFSGRLSTLGIDIANANFASTGANPNQNVLFGGVSLGGWGVSEAASHVIDTETAGVTKALLVQSATTMYGDPPASPSIDDAWLRDMLAATVQDTSRRRSTAPAGATSVRITRLAVDIANTGVRITR
jgi:hypothetical protein